MIVTPAIQDVLYFMQAWKVASKLTALLECMDIPRYRIKVDELHNIQWLDRNMSINNSEHHLYPEARRLLTRLFHNSQYHALRWEMWRSID